MVGTLVVHAKGWDDTAKDDGDKDKKPKPEAAMSYVAYFKRGAPAADRPITFLFNGGPGSATLWLHMGSFGPGPCRHKRPHPYPGRALQDRQQ